MQDLGKLVDGKGNVLVEMFAASNGLSKDAGGIAHCLYLLSETLIRGLDFEHGGGLGGEFGYGCDYENDVFMMHHYCWCEKDECQWCSGSAPNFLHKASGFSIRWYKWIGRDMEPSRKNITKAQWLKIFKECWESIPVAARKKAKKEHDFDNSPRQVKKRGDAMARMWEVMSQPEKFGCEPKKRVCDSCGKEYEYTQWFTIICGSCDDCMKKRFAQQ